MGGGDKKPMMGGKKFKPPPLPLSSGVPQNAYGQIPGSKPAQAPSSIIKPGRKDSHSSKRNVTVTEEELEDENSVMDGSYMGDQTKRDKNTSK
jgi:hypothetical protein